MVILEKYYLFLLQFIKYFLTTSFQNFTKWHETLLQIGFLTIFVYNRKEIRISDKWYM